MNKNSNTLIDLLVLVLGWMVFGFIVGLAVGYAQKAHGAEPSFCQLDEFRAHEIQTHSPGVKNLRAFKFNDVIINGLAVGGSPAAETAKLAPKECIWYFNKGNHDAEKMFNWLYLPGPYWGWIPGFHWIIAKIYDHKLRGQAEKIVACIKDKKVFVGGCDAQHHRGPSVHAWLYGLAGCSPKSATRMANFAWGGNGVAFFAREEIAEKGWDLGNEQPELRNALQSVMVK